MENLHDFTESEAELSALNAEDSSSENAKSSKPENNNSRLPPFGQTNTGYEYPPIAEKTPIAEEKNTTNLVGDQNPAQENSDKSLRFEPTEYKNAPLEPKNLVFSKEPAENKKQEQPKETSLRFEPTEYKNVPLEEKKLDFSCFDKPAEDKNEEIPPALMPFFEVADVLEKELPKQDQANEEEKKALAENILEKANDAKLSQYAHYLGLGGKIYVHVLDYRGQHTQGDITIPYTKEHYINAAKESNERFKKLDINLSVVIVFDDFNAAPLTQEEFQTRKADKAKRKKMPDGFDENYHPMDSYIVVNIKNDEANTTLSHKRDKGIEPWLNYLSSTKNPKEWQDAFTDNEATFGKSSGSNFLAMLNCSSLNTAVQRFHHIKLSDNSFSVAEIDKQIAEAIAEAIEHEIGHSKFLHYSENENKYMEGDANNNSLGKPTLKAYLSASRDDKNAFKYREHFVKASPGLGGHISKTIMDASPKISYIKNTELQDKKELYEGYDIYMVTMLKLLHGSQTKSKLFDFKEYKTTLAELRLQRSTLYLQLQVSNPDNADLLISEFETIEKTIEAYVDVLAILDTRQDFQVFLKNEQALQTSNDKLEKAINNTNLPKLKYFEAPN